MEREIEAEEKRIKEEKRQWKTVKIFESISPKGGEDGTDGYFDAEYKSLSGETVRMVSRNVFDFGSYRDRPGKPMSFSHGMIGRHGQ